MKLRRGPFVLVSALLLGAALLLGGCGAGEVPDEPQTSGEYLLWEDAVREGYEGSFLDFLDEYFREEEPSTVSSENETAGIQSALSSAVKIKSQFTVSLGSSSFGGREYTVQLAGSGVVYSLDGEGGMYVLTNYHVVFDSSSNGREVHPHISDDITVWLYGWSGEGSEMPATFVGGAMDCDVALIHVDGSDLTKDGISLNAAVIANSGVKAVDFAEEWVRAGQRVYAIGNPNDEGISVVQGIVSVEAEYIEMTALDGIGREEFLEIRTDAAINHGNSGGGLFNGAGEFVGLVNARSEVSGITGFGYALPADFVRAVADNILDNAREYGGTGAYRATLGAQILTQKSESEWDEVQERRVIHETLKIQSVDAGSVSQGKLQAGDVLLSLTLNEETYTIGRYHDLTVALFKVRLGDTLTLTVLRGGVRTEVELVFDNLRDFTLFD